MSILRPAREGSCEVGTLEVGDWDNIKGMSVIMLETDRRGGNPCADRLRLLQLAGPVLYRVEKKAGVGVTVEAGNGIEGRL